LVTARKAAEEEGVTRKQLATKQCQGSVSYGVGSQAIYRGPCSSRGRKKDGWVGIERKMDIENGVYRVGGPIIEILSCNWLKCTINTVVNPTPRLWSPNA
jgi:hypothetical protein